MVKIVFKSAEEMLAFGSGPLGTSSWMLIEQERVNQFADATNDHQWIHIDAERAKQGPFGGCVAHGYLTLALTSYFQPEIYEVHMKLGINYGLNRVRFPAPLKVGSRIRGHAEMLKVERMKDGGVQTEERVTVEVEGESKPACVADMLSRFYF